MSRRFRLSAVERLRAGKLSEAVQALASARRELSAALGYRDRIKSELQRTTAAWCSSPAEQQVAADRRVQLREELTVACDRCDTAQGQELAALAAWTAARANLRAVELLHERHRLALAEADAHTEQRELDEFAALSHQRGDVESTLDLTNPVQGGDDT